MGTRSGDLDPAIVDFVSAKEGMTPRDVDAMLNKQSGMLGVSGLTADMRELLAKNRSTPTGGRVWRSISSPIGSRSTSARIWRR
jgi:acetate kinase